MTSVSGDADNRYVVVADLGIDKLTTYRFDGNFGESERRDNHIRPSRSDHGISLSTLSPRFAQDVNELRRVSPRFLSINLVVIFRYLGRRPADASGSLSRRERLRRSSDQSERALSLWVELRPQQYCYPMPSTSRLVG